MEHFIQPDTQWALTVAAIYFGSIITTGIVLRKACDWLMGRVGVDLDEVHAQAGPNRAPRQAFLLGSWRTEK